MFTGIIETIGKIKFIKFTSSGLRIDIINEELAGKINVDDSVAVNGICLTVLELHQDGFAVDAVMETIERSTLKEWGKGQRVNLERGMPLNGRFDGHIVQGHVDGRAELMHVIKTGNSAEMHFKTSKTIAAMMVEKGSVALDGVSLTIASMDYDSFSVAVIPYTLSNTTFNELQPGNKVNLETDIIGKYITKFMQNKNELNRSTLRSWGYKL